MTARNLRREIVVNMEWCVNYLMGNITESGYWELKLTWTMENSITDRSGWDKGMKQNYTNKVRKEHKVDCNMQGKEWSAASKVQSTRWVSWRRRSLLRFSERAFNLELRGKLLLVFHMVSTVIKYKCYGMHRHHGWFYHELHDMVIHK